MAGQHAVFLDRDGTIAQHVPYMRTADQLRLLPGAGEAIARLNAAGLLTVVVSNQSGIARGFLTEARLAQIHARMREELRRFGAWIDAIYCCTHHPDDGCACRKPRPGLLLRAAQELGVSLPQSVMIGDQPLDIMAGRSAGARSVLVRTGPAPHHGAEEDASVRPDFTAATLVEAVEWILAPRPRGRPRRLVER